VTRTDRAGWAAPYAPTGVHGVVRVPGSKSATNRALVLGALAVGSSRLRRPLRSRDTELMAAALRGLGAEVIDQDRDWVVTPGGLRGPADVNVGLAGTVMRFVPPVATLATGEVRFDGDARARERPIAPLLDALRTLGAEVDDDGRGALPFSVQGRGSFRGGNVEVDASASSQIISGLLLPAARWDDGVVVRHIGPGAVPNAPHLRMTAAMLRDRGVVVHDHDPGTWRVSPGPIAGRDEPVEPDLSSAAPFLAAAVVTGGTVAVEGWPQESTQPGAVLPTLLEQLGATVRSTGGQLTVAGGRVHGAELDLRDGGELVPVLAAIAAVADGPSTFTGVGYLRGHETDRLRALATELGRLGCGVTETDDGLRIEPRPMHGDVFRTYADHRLAMAGAVLALVVPDLVVEDVETTAKTYPEFAADWLRLVTGAAD
jgi:3-phosphoshikimate 1-carboxyvinyltransferase